MGQNSDILIGSDNSQDDKHRDQIENDSDSMTTGNFQISMDQDYFYVLDSDLNDDRNYTQGTSFTYAHPELLNSILFYPIRAVVEGFSKPGRYQRTGMSSISILGTAFTPLVLDSINPIIGDRPFSFLFAISTSATFKRIKKVKLLPTKDRPFNRKEAISYHTFSLNVGLLGSRLGYDFQSFAHEYLVKGRPTDPKGWDTQISNGGYPTLLIGYNRFQNVKSFAPKKMKKIDRALVDLGWNIGGSVGYYDRLYSGLFLRLGRLRTESQVIWNNSGSALAGAQYMRSENIKKSDFSTEFFFYGKASTVLMLRNAMLVGQRIDLDEYRLNPEWARSAIFEFEIGLTFALEDFRREPNNPRVWSITAKQFIRSPEFDSDIFEPRWHYFGGISLIIPVG